MKTQKGKSLVVILSGDDAKTKPSPQPITQEEDRVTTQREKYLCRDQEYGLTLREAELSVRMTSHLLSPRRLIGLFLLLLCTPLWAQLETESFQGQDVVANEVLVKFETATSATPISPSATAIAISQAQLAEDIDLAEEIGAGDVLRFHSRTKDVTTLVKELSARPGVRYAEPNFVVHAIDGPNDPLFGNLWGLQNTGQVIQGVAGKPGADTSAVSAWKSSKGSRAPVVAVVDTGIDYNHPDLAPNVWSAPASFTVKIGSTAITCPAGSHGFNAITNACDPLDDNEHGTHVSGTLGAAGNNHLGVVGVNWTTSIMGVKFLDSRGTGTTANAINAIEFTVQTKSKFGAAVNVRVLSNSWGSRGFSQSLLDEIKRANSNDMLFVAAAGNNSTNNDAIPFYPASYQSPNVIAVAATDNTDSLAWFSDFGASSVHLGAPGDNVLSTLPGGNYGFLSGTSMATPHVSGAAALVLSRCAFNTANLKADILNNVDPIPALAGMTMTGGRLDINRAISGCSQSPEGSGGLVDLLDTVDRTVDVYSLGADHHVHILYFNPSSGWHKGDVTSAAGAPDAAPGSALTNLMDTIDSTPDVFYMGSDEHVHILWFQPSSASWHTEDVTATAGAPNAAPGSALTDLMDTIYGTPDVFYVGGDQHVHVLWFTPSSGSWHTADVTAAAGGPNAAPSSALASLMDTIDGTPDVFYLGEDQHVHILWFRSGWHTGDVTMAAGAPNAAAGSPVADLLDTIDGTPDVFYLGEDQHVHILWFRSGWHTGDVTVAAGAPKAARLSALTNVMDTIDGTPDVFYLDANQHVRILWFAPSSGTWHTGDVTAAAGGAPAASGSHLSDLMDTMDGTPDVFYRDANQDVHILWFTPLSPAWHTADISATSH